MRFTIPAAITLSVLPLALGLAQDARAATYDVGPGQPFATLNALFGARDLAGGDLVRLHYAATPYGNVVMPAGDGGAPGNPVTIRGIANGSGARPVIREDAAGNGGNGVEVQANHVVIEDLEITGTGTVTTGTLRCYFHHSHDVTLRRIYVHDCPRHGVLGADQDSGSLTIDASEIYNVGSTPPGFSGNHAIYMATDQTAYPGAVFRLQNSWIHDARFSDASPGANLVKSRAERNEIYGNWLEGAYFHELELIGPDPEGAAAGWSDGLAREDSDVVGNVILHTSANGGNVIRAGGDGTSNGRGESFGRYRFVNNTIVIDNGSGNANVFRAHFGIESLEMHNNVIHRIGGGQLRVMYEETPTEWVAGRRVRGSNNWVIAGAVMVPSAAEWIGTLSGTNPGLVDLAARNFRPASSASAVVDAGASPPITPPGYEIANPYFPPGAEPPERDTTATPRVIGGVIDLGAYERVDAGSSFANSFE